MKVNNILSWAYEGNSMTLYCNCVLKSFTVLVACNGLKILDADVFRT